MAQREEWSPVFKGTLVRSTADKEQSWNAYVESVGLGVSETFVTKSELNNRSQATAYDICHPQSKDAQFLFLESALLYPAVSPVTRVRRALFIKMLSRLRSLSYLTTSQKLQSQRKRRRIRLLDQKVIRESAKKNRGRKCSQSSLVLKERIEPEKLIE